MKRKKQRWAGGRPSALFKTMSTGASFLARISRMFENWQASMQLAIATSSNWGTEMCLVLLIYDVTFFSSLQGVLLGPVEKNGLKRVGNTSLSMYLSHLSHLCHPLKRSCSSQLPFVECMR